MVERKQRKKPVQRNLKLYALLYDGRYQTVLRSRYRTCLITHVTSPLPSCLIGDIYWIWRFRLSMQSSVKCMNFSQLNFFYHSNPHSPIFAHGY